MTTADFPDWTEAVTIPGSSSAGPASLSGAGETATPGDLTQAGGFTVNETTGTMGLQSTTIAGVNIDDTSSTGVTITEHSSGDVVIQAEGNPGSVQILSSGSHGLILSSTGGGATLQCSGGPNLVVAQLGIGDLIVECTSTGNIRLTTSHNLAISCGKLGFFGVTPVSIPNVSGSKGGNVALGNLMTALANLGLVIDSTT